MHRRSQRKPVCNIVVGPIVTKLACGHLCSYTVKDLLALPFFSELEGIEIKATPSNNDDEVRLVFQVPIKGNKGQNQLQQQQPAYETYERLFSLHSDQAQNIAQDMVNGTQTKKNFMMLISF